MQTIFKPSEVFCLVIGFWVPQNDIFAEMGQQIWTKTWRRSFSESFSLLDLD